MRRQLASFGLASSFLVVIASALVAGQPIRPETKVQVGDKLFGKRVANSIWSDCEVVEISGNGKVKLRWSGLPDAFNTEVSKTSLERAVNIGDDDVVKVGDLVLRDANGRSDHWEEAEISEILDKGRVKVHYPGFGKNWDKVVRKTSLRWRGVPPDRAAPKAGTATVAAEMRTWTDSTGTHKIEAQFAGLADGKVTLKKADGKTVTLALDRLSEADRKQAEALAKADASSNPFEAPGDTTPAEKTADQSDVDAPTYKRLKADWSAAIVASASITKPLVIPPDAVGNETIPAPAQPIALTHKAKTGDSARTILFPPGGKQAWVVLVDEKPAVSVSADGKSRSVSISMTNGKINSSKTYVCEQCDLSSGKRVASYTFPDSFCPLAIAPSGTRLLSACTANNEIHLVDLWDADAASGMLKHVIRWQASPHASNKSNPTVRAAEFLSESQVLIEDSNHRLVLWEAEKAKAVYSAQLVGGDFRGIGWGRIGLTPSRKYVLAPTKSGLCLYEALTGTLVGGIADTESKFVWAAVSPDGKRIAAASDRDLKVFDVASGKPVISAAVPPALANVRFEWLTNEQLLMEGGWVFDPALGVSVWKLDPAKTGSESKEGPLKWFGGQLWSVAKTGDSAAFILKHSSPPQDTMAQSTARLDAAKVRVFPPGSRVKLDVQLDKLNGDDRTKVLEHLNKIVTDAGAVVAAEGELTLVAKVTPGKPETINYRTLGLLLFGPGESATFTPHRHELKLLNEDRILWNSTLTTTAPRTLKQKDGQSVADALAETGAPQASFFLRARLHPLLTKPGPDDGAYGRSAL